MLASIRRYWNLTSHAAIVSGGLRKVWDFLRKQTTHTHNVYQRVKKIAESRKIDIPEPLVNMEIEHEVQ